MTFKLKGQMTSDHVKALLNEKYSDADKCLIAFEVNEGTGSAGGRRIDALAMMLWPSLDYKIIGFEIKVSRSDWLNEMKQPEKSQAISRYCDEFYLVAPYGVLGIDELPKTWGHIQVTEDRIFTKIKAPQREPVPLDRTFVASFMRQATRKYSDKKLLEAQLERAREEIKREETAWAEGRINRLDGELASVKKMVADFEGMIGMKLNNYSMGSIAEVINAIKDKRTIEQQIENVQRRIDLAKASAEADKKALASLKKLLTKGKACQS